MPTNNAKFSIGEIVKHRHFDFRGVIYDVDFEFNNSEEWYQSIPKDVRPKKDQPFYHLLAESNDVTYEAYVSEQNLLIDSSGDPVLREKRVQVTLSLQIKAKSLPQIQHFLFKSMPNILTKVNYT